MIGPTRSGKLYRLSHASIEHGNGYIKRFQTDNDALEFFTCMWNEIKKVRTYEDSRETGKRFEITYMDDVYSRHDHASWWIERLDLEEIGDAMIEKLPWKVLKFLDLGYFESFDFTFTTKPLVLQFALREGCSLCGKNEGFVKGSTVHQLFTNIEYFANLCTPCKDALLAKMKGLENVVYGTREIMLASWWLDTINQQYEK